METTAVELETMATEGSATGASSAILASDLPPVDRGKDAWMFVASAFVLETFVWGFGFTYGVFQSYYTSSPASPFLSSSPTAISAVGTASLAVQYMGIILLLTICQRYPSWIKRMMWLALALGCGCLLASSFATAVWQLILVQGVLFGVAGGLLYAPVICWLAEWFVERRGLAGGFIFGGSGVGGALFPPVVGYLLEQVGFRWTLRIWAVIMAMCTGWALWVIKPRIPVSASSQARLAPMDFSFFSNKVFGVVMITILIQALAYSPVALYMPTFTSSLGLPALDGALVLSTFNLCGVIGQVVFGHLCDRMPYSRIMIFSAVGSALAAYLLWGFARNLGLVFAFVIIFGSLSGGFSSIWPLAAAEVAGANSPTAGLVFGSFGVVKGIAAIVGPIIAGILHEPAYGSRGFGKVTLFVGGMMVATAAGSVASAIASHITRHHGDRRASS